MFMAAATNGLTCPPRHGRETAPFSILQGDTKNFQLEKPKSRPTRESNLRPLHIQSLTLATRPTRKYSLQ